jgi:hypothetical protein
MQVLHKNGFTPSERNTFLPIINENILECLHVVISYLKSKGVPFDKPETQVRLCCCI